MCGINGIFYFDPARFVRAADIDAMRHVARHRGPDDVGLYLDGCVGLGFNRLSIIDLSGGHQPMSNEDGTVWIVFNGEIYNFQSLHEDLIARGHQFRTKSDTETIIHAWEEYGEECVTKLRGMFAFAIWDSRRQILFGARDRLGIKPFYYYYDQHTFAFGSELKSLLELPGIPRDLNTEALGEYLRCRYVIAPHTMLRHVRKLEPGHTLTVTHQGVSFRRYWDIPVETPVPMTEPEALEQLESLVEQTLRMHLIADVPLGAFLSGGVDSSYLVGLMARLGVANIKTFSIGYDDALSELDYARVVAERFRTDHHELRLRPGTFGDTLPKVVWHMDEPVGDPASIPLYYLAEFARRKVTVVLSGEGSDEIFNGYPIYARMLQFEKCNRVPGMSFAGKLLGAVAGDTKIRKYAEMLGRPLEERYQAVGGLFTARQTKDLILSGESGLNTMSDIYARCRGRSALARMSYLDHTSWLAEDLLVKADRMTMAQSLELRVPFLDHHMVEFGARLPKNLKIRRNITKYLLKKSAERLLPSDIVYRPKQGFSVPIRSWFRKDLAEFARDTLLSSGGIARQYFSPAALLKLFEAHRLEDRSEQIYSLLVLQTWHHEYL